MPKMPKIQSEITCHTKNRKNLNLNEKGQSTHNTKLSQMLELSHKDFQATNKKSALVSNYKQTWNK